MSICITYCVPIRQNQQIIFISRVDSPANIRRILRIDSQQFAAVQTANYSLCEPVANTGTLPKLEDGTVSRTSCTVESWHNCTTKYDIQVRYCENVGYIYHLPPTSQCSSAYCMGKHLYIMLYASYKPDEKCLA